MRSYVYNQSGFIVRTELSQNGAVESPLASGEIRVVGIADGLTQYVDVETKELVLYPFKPSPHHIFNYTTKQWNLDVEAAWRVVRQQRDQLLTLSDWTQLPDVPVILKLDWVVYRQALRDITLQSDPLAITWPIK